MASVQSQIDQNLLVNLYIATARQKIPDLHPKELSEFHMIAELERMEMKRETGERISNFLTHTYTSCAQLENSFGGQLLEDSDMFWDDFDTLLIR